MIGKWAVRVLTRASGRESMHGKAHLVESEIEERVVTRCGRELPRETRNGILEEFYAGLPLDPRACLPCQGPAR